MSGESFGIWLRGQLRRREMTGSDLARKMDRPASMINRWAAGDRIPGPSSCERLAEALGIDLDLVLWQAGHRPNVEQIDPDDPRTLIGGWVDISPNTRRNYVNRLRPLQQHVGHIPLNRLTPADLDGAYGTMRRQKQSASAVRYAHRILKQALRRAVVLDMIAANPCDRVTPPKAERHEPNTWTQAEMQAFLSAEIEHPVWGDFWAVLCETWLRVGEITDLRWADVDSKQNQIRISHAVRRNDALDNESGPVKTDNAKRTIPVSRSLIERLLLRRMRLGNPKATALVFPSQRTGSWIEAHVARKALVAACERADVPVIGLHEVRHSGGSIAYLAGIDLKTISARLGHSDVAFTARVYVHLNDAHQKSAADVIWGLISPARVKLWQRSDGDDPESGGVTGENRTA